MKAYDKIEDFLEDKSFKQWVLDNDPVHEKYWLEWLAVHPSHIDLVEHAKIILLELDSSENKWEAKRQEKVFLKILDKVDHENKGIVKNRYSVYTSYTSTIEKRVRAVMAVCLSLVFIAAALQLALLEKTEGPLALEEKQEEWVINSNPKGQKSVVHLADGSTVALNAESEIRFGSDFGKGHREIHLEGEAFFEVASDSLLPFKVYSGELTTIALGTSFNINAYKEGGVQVQLATGKIKVSKESMEDQSFDLVPGEEIVLNLNHQLNKGKFDLAKAFQWKDGVLLFEKTPFKEVLVMLERWYAVEVTVKNLPTKEPKISGEFQSSYLKDVLESLGYAYGFDYSINNKEVSIHFKP